MFFWGRGPAGRAVYWQPAGFATVGSKWPGEARSAYLVSFTATALPVT